MTEEMRTIEAYHIGPVAMFFGKLLGGWAKEMDENGETHLGKKYGEPDPTTQRKRVCANYKQVGKV